MNDDSLPKTKKTYNHYVPQFYLRIFSDNKNSVGSYIFKARKRVNDTAIARTGGRHNLYGDSGELESVFIQWEGEFSTLLNEIVHTEKLPSTEAEIQLLLYFVAMSEARTAFAADEKTDLFRQQAIKLLLEKQFDFSIEPPLTREELDDYSITLDTPNFEALKQVDSCVKTICHLQKLLIVNCSNLGFITSDVPVAKFNLYKQLKGIPDFVVYDGCETMGLQLFIPLSPKLCLVLYDGITYHVETKENILRLQRDEDVMQLNELFLHNAYQMIYFNSRESEERINQLVKKRIQTKEAHSLFIPLPSNEALVYCDGNSVKQEIDLPFFSINPAFG